MPSQHLFIYVVDRDFGFAPNPFHGVCTLATCKPKIRSVARPGDWVVGVGGKKLKATGRCVFAMRVGRKLTFNDYWNDPLYRDKRPVRNGSKKMVVGDNIYHRDSDVSDWQQEDSHHSLPDGSVNIDNLRNDTQTNAVLISDLFFYFGAGAPVLPSDILTNLGYKNGIGHRKYKMVTLSPAQVLIDWIRSSNKGFDNLVQGDPFDFSISGHRYSVKTNKVSE